MPPETAPSSEPGPVTVTAAKRYPWRIKCNTCGWVDTFAEKLEADQRATAHSSGPDGPHLVRVVRRVDPLDRAVEDVGQHQRCGFFHPYTCGNSDHDWRKDDDWTTLKPEKRGGDIWLVCPCGYEQRLTAMDGMIIEGVRIAGDPLAEFRARAQEATDAD